MSTFTKSRLPEKKQPDSSCEIPNTCSQPNHAGRFVLLCEDSRNIFPSVELWIRNPEEDNDDDDGGFVEGSEVLIVFLKPQMNTWSALIFNGC